MSTIELQRTPQAAPKPCYGLEFQKVPTLCATCEYFNPCKTASKSRVGLVPLTKARVVLAQLEDKNKDEIGLIQSEYELYHRAILRRRAKYKLDRESGEKVAKQAEEAGVEPGLLIMASLLGHRRTNAAAPFYCNMLIGGSATRRLNLYREECANRYAAFDATTIGRITKLPDGHDVMGRLERSEKLAAQWGVSASLRMTNFTSLYAERELGLDPWWLATEPSYFKWRSESEEIEAPSKDIVRHRHRVKMAGRAASFAAILHAREKIAVKIAVHEAERHALRAEQVAVPAKVSQPRILWQAIARVSATVQALSILAGD